MFILNLTLKLLSVEPKCNWQALLFDISLLAVLPRRFSKLGSVVMEENQVYIGGNLYLCKLIACKNPSSCVG